ncbi:MAG: LarC family nickel insertion protein, partial [Bacteroidales bacterium]|nr:LarC family nickel insertion protein [Bacteroidales bacterium]
MKVLFYDCFAGISGDMNLAALTNIGVPPDYLTKELQKLNISDYEIQFSEEQRKGITGTQVNVLLKNEHHHHEEQEHAEHHHHHHHEHRNLHDIEHIINNSQLSDKVKGMSMDIFRLVAKAEAKIHGKPVDEIHFHEVGAIDSIVDIVGAAICIDYLKPNRIIASPVQMGGGFVHCAHGVFPVPAPATLEIMQGKPMKFGAVPFETATPTGVAILAALADEFT